MNTVALKIGGSLYDLPDLQGRLRSIISSCDADQILLIPGGGATTDAVRAFDQTHRLGEEASHWLALHALTLNAHFLRHLLPEYAIVAQLPTPEPRAILDAHAFARADDSEPDHCPHTWDATSDSLAVRAAFVAKAHSLILVKRVAWTGTWQDAVQAGVVDSQFPKALERAPALDVRLLNFHA